MEQNEQFINFASRRCDLEKTAEYWQSSSYADKMSAIEKAYEKIRGYMPNSNNRLIREGVFLIKGSTRMEDIVGIVEPVRQKFKIECFQIAIHRDVNEAHLLFSWLDDGGWYASGVVMNRTDMTKLSVYILRKLHLPRPACADTWQRYFLLDAFAEDKEIFSRETDRIMHDDNIPARSYDILQDALRYAENMCKGIVK